METFKIKFPEGITHHLIEGNSEPLIELLVFENSITIYERISGYASRLTFDAKNSTQYMLAFTTRTSIFSYFAYQIDIMVDISGIVPIFAICSGIPLFGIFNDTYILTTQ